MRATLANPAGFFNGCKVRVVEGMPLPSASGLREWKKARTRLAISDVATRLFVERGFEAVTVSDIAAAAEVSVKTVFNYFASKEELFFDRADDVIGAIADAVLERPAGTTVVAALHAVLAGRCVPFDARGWRALRDPEGYERFRGFIATEHASPALRARRLVIAEGWTDRLASVIAVEWGVAEHDPRPRALASMVLAVMGLRERVLSGAILERRAPRTVEARVRAVVDEAFARLALGFADVDVPAGAR
jgi:AcrR family transcriptional regulator